MKVSFLILGVLNGLNPNCETSDLILDGVFVGGSYWIVWESVRRIDTLCATQKKPYIGNARRTILRHLSTPTCLSELQRHSALPSAPATPYMSYLSVKFVSDVCHITGFGIAKGAHVKWQYRL